VANYERSNADLNGNPRNISRRAMLRYSASGLAIAGGGTLLAACGSSGGSASTSGPTTAGSSGAAAAAGSLTSAEKQTLLKMAGPSNPKFLGTGLAWSIGAMLPYSGPNEAFSTILGDGLTLAAQHITQLGGPKVKTNYQNNGGPSGVNTQAAVEDMLTYHGAGVGSVVSSADGSLGSVIPGAARYQILTIDATSGVGIFAGKPYYWAFRCNFPYNNTTISLEHAKVAYPSAKSVTVVFNSGAAGAQQLAGCVSAAKAAGYTAYTSTLPQGTTDWSDAYTQIHSQNPGLVIVVLVGDDAAYFLKGFTNAGLKQPIYTFSYTAAQQTLAGTGYNNVYIVQENYLPDSPTNDWQTIFTKYYRSQFPSQPSNPASPAAIAANYYNMGFVLWDLASRVLAKGGDINNGEQMQAALAENPTFPSIYGGSGTTAGQVVFDTTGHGLASCPLGVAQIRNGAPVLVASANAVGTSGAGPLTMA
jgi:branched-chain amino acid transport system substrate-binding protein